MTNKKYMVTMILDVKDEDDESSEEFIRELLEKSIDGSYDEAIKIRLQMIQEVTGIIK
jgi:ATP-dependent Clp protease adapter protein ClpS